MDTYDAELEATVRAEIGEEYDDYSLITDYLAGELSPADRERVEDRMRTDPTFRALAEPLIMIWNIPGPLDREPDLADRIETERSWQKLKKRIELEELGIHTPTRDEKRARRRRRRRFAFTAIAALITGWLGTWLRPQWMPVPSVYVHADAPPDEERAAKLPDETQVTLAPGSRLTYLHWFGSPDEHTLNLDGEATFTIASGPRGPLVVDGPGVEVKAAEGRFTIEAFVARPIAYVMVHDGRAEVRARTLFGYGQVLTLRAGEGARVGPGLSIERVDPPIAAHRTRIK